MRQGCRRLSIEKPDHRHGRLLRVCRERPRRRRAAEQRDELASFQLIELHSMSASQSRTVGYRIDRDQSAVECFCNRSWSCLRSQAAAPLRVRHDERADRAVITAAPEAYMAMVVLTRLHLLTREQVAGRDVEPARALLHKLIAGNREAIHIAAAGQRIPRMCQRWDSGNQRRNKEHCQSNQRHSLNVVRRARESTHSITSAARARTVVGVPRPRAFAVLKLTINAHSLGACTGKSAGLSPLKKRSTYPAGRLYWSSKSRP